MGYNFNGLFLKIHLKENWSLFVLSYILYSVHFSWCHVPLKYKQLWLLRAFFIICEYPCFLGKDGGVVSIDITTVWNLKFYFSLTVCNSKTSLPYYLIHSWDEGEEMNSYLFCVKLNATDLAGIWTLLTDSTYYANIHYIVYFSIPY